MALHVPNPDWRPPSKFWAKEREAAKAIRLFTAGVKQDLSAKLRTHHKVRYKSNITGVCRRDFKLFCERPDVYIAMGDKDRAPVLCTPQQYHAEMLRQLPEDTYRLLSKDEAVARLHSTWNEVQNFAHLLCPNGEGKFKQAAKLISTKVTIQDILREDGSVHLGEAYILFKTHKDPVVGRLIVPNHTYLTMGISKWLDHELKPIVFSYPTICRDTASFILDIERSQFSQDCRFSTLDVAALYPSINLDRAFILIEDLLKEAFPNDLRKVGFIMSGLKIVMRNNVFQYNGTFRLQLNGTGMGITCAVAFANLFMYALERSLVQKYLKSGDLEYYSRYIDDIFSVFRSDTACTNFETEFNQLDPDIQVSGPRGDSVPYLDVTVYKGKRFATSRTPDLRLYQKATCTHSYLPYASYHTSPQKLNTIGAELRRFLICTSDSKLFHSICRMAYEWFLARGYTKNELRGPFGKYHFNERGRVLDALRNRDLSRRKQAPSPNLYCPRDPFSTSLPLQPILEKRWKDLQEVLQLQGPPPGVVLLNQPSIRRICAKYNKNKLVSMV